jgi:hypothetical protein
LKDLGKAGKGPLAETALALARELDDDGNSATSKSMCAKAMVDVLRELRTLAPPKVEDTDLERARKRRADRVARGAAAPAASSS